MDNTERFSNRVENYIRYRPHYPISIISFLKNEIGLSRQATVADIGSGTGISSELFLRNGNKVYGVEPNEAMRKAAEKAFEGNKNFISINGTAEATTLPDSSTDLIVAGQAFHWFDENKCKEEFQRIATPGSYLSLMWNERKLESDFQKTYEKMLKEFGVDYETVHHRNVDEKALGDFFAPFSFSTHTFENSQILDFEGLKGRLLSSSFIPLEGSPNYASMLARLRQIFDVFSKDSQITFVYSCKLYYGKIK